MHLVLYVLYHTSVNLDKKLVCMDRNIEFLGPELSLIFSISQRRGYYIHHLCFITFTVESHQPCSCCKLSHYPSLILTYCY